MSNNNEPGSAAPAAGGQPNPAPSENATGNAGGETTPTKNYDPASFGAGITKAKAELQPKLDALQAKITELEKAKVAADRAGASTEELTKQLAERDAALEALKAQTEGYQTKYRGILDKRVESLPEQARGPIKARLEANDLAVAEQMLDLAEALRPTESAPPPKSSEHRPLGKAQGEAFDYEGYDKALRRGGQQFEEWVEKNGGMLNVQRALRLRPR